MKRRAGFRSLPIALVLLASYILTVAQTAAAAARPEATTLLRRADQVRNPYLGTVVEIDLSVVAKASGGQLRASRQTLLTHRSGRSLMLLHTKNRRAPGALLIADGRYHLLLPHSERPVELSLRHAVAGDLSHAGFLRTNLRFGYEPRHDGQETIDGTPCWRLELEPRQPEALFGRVRYWIAGEGTLPMRIEFYSTARTLLKTVRFVSYQDTGIGRRPERIEIEDTGRPGEKAILTLGKPRGAATSRLAFDLDDLEALRQAEGDEARAPTGGKRLVDALAAAARSRKDTVSAPRED